MTFSSLSSSSSTLDFAAVAPQQAPSYAAVGGGAAPFFDLFFDPSTSGNFFASPCARHAARRAAGAGNGDKRRRSRDSAPTTPRRRNIDAGVGPPAFAARYAGTNRLGKLYCRTGFHLQIHADGRVNGTRRDNSRFGVLEFLSVAIGLVSIKGKESNRYLCMNQKGKLYGSANHSTDCIFMERMLENYYNTYTSCKYSRKNRKWFVALNKRGRPRKGGRSKKKQKFSQFLVLHLDDDDDVGGQQQQQKRRNFFKSIVDNSNGNNIRRSGQQQAPAGRQLGIGSFTDKWQQSRKAADANVVMRVWTRRRDEKHLHIANNLDENRRRRRTDNTNIDKIYQKNIHNNNNNSGNNGNHNERRTGWRRAAFVDENG